MTPDLLSTIQIEIDERLSELRPLLAEHERLLEATEALVTAGHEDVTPAAVKTPASKRARAKSRIGAGRRGSAAGAIERAATAPSEIGAGTHVTNETTGSVSLVTRRAAGSAGSVVRPKSGSAPTGSAVKPKPERAARGAARETILAALDHGSHTVGELAVVTALSASNVNGNLRKLVSEGAIVKIEREGKAAWALPRTAV
jgi:hypothetical protein